MIKATVEVSGVTKDEFFDYVGAAMQWVRSFLDAKVTIYNGSSVYYTNC